MKIFETKLSQMQSKIDRAVVIGQFVSMMRQIEYPATKITTIMNQLLDEKNQHLINDLTGALTLAQQYLPIDKVPDFKKEVAEFFLKKAKKDTDSKELQRYCIDKAISFMTQQENLKIAAEWIRNDKVTVES